MSMTDEIRQRYWLELADVAGALAANLAKISRHPGQLAGNAIDGGTFWSSEFTVAVNAELPVREEPSRLEAVDSYLADNLLINLAAEFPEFGGIGDWRDLAKDTITPGMIKILHLVAHRRTFHRNCEVSLSWGGESAPNAAAALTAFLGQYPEGSATDSFYRCYLSKSVPPLGLTSTTAEIQRFVYHDCGKPGITQGGRHAYYRAIRAFFNWVFSPASHLGLSPGDNPITWVKAPKVDRKLMPAQDKKSFAILLSHVHGPEDRAIISMLYDSSGRLAEVSGVAEPDILWDRHRIKVKAKGGKEVLMPLGEASEILIKDWLTEYNPNGGRLWRKSKSGIVSMLRRLEVASGVKCNAHTFRRGFASELRRKGVDSLDIMKLGHWKSIRMVQTYTETVDFEDSQRRYVAPTAEVAKVAGDDLPAATRGLADATRGLPEMTGGLPETSVVPRNRIELLTRGFSVRCSTY
jgi:integrase